MSGHTATSTITIAAPIEEVWEALVNTTMIKQYRFGSEVVSESLSTQPSFGIQSCKA